MRRLVRWLVWLYPGWWRRRYGDELVALIEDAEPGWQHPLDVITGALSMRIGSGPGFALSVVMGGALAGLAIGSLQSDVYAASGVILLEEAALGRPDGRTNLYATLERSLDLSDEERDRASIALLDRPLSNNRIVVRLTSRDTRPADARESAQRLTDRLQAALPHARIIDYPRFPDTPARPRYPLPMTSAAGALLGLGLGGLVLRLRRMGQPSSHPTIAAR